MKTVWGVLVGVALLSGPSAAQENSQLFSKVENAEGVTILEGIRPVLTFQKAIRSKDGRWQRSNYVHPVYDLDGEVITEDFPSDHGHHRGIFWAWHQVWVADQAMGDSWACQDFVWDVRQVDVHCNYQHALIETDTLWMSRALIDDYGAMLPFVRESARITVHPSDQQKRMIDFVISLRALVDDVRLGGSDDDKGYGGFSPRVKLPADLRFLGRDGPIEPKTTQVSGGPWVDVSYADGGVAILCHRSNPGYPQPWILRPARSMQNAVFPGREPIKLSQIEPLILKYRIVLHRGQLMVEELERLLDSMP